MSRNVVESLRQASVDNLFSINSFSSSFTVWAPEIAKLAPGKTPSQILDLGDHLSDIFRTTRISGRSQSAVSAGGTAWEALVCWYLNLCLIGRRTVVIKHKKELIPRAVNNAITVNYKNFISNTESDLIAINFPNREDYSSDMDALSIFDKDGNPVLLKKSARSRRYNLSGVMDALCYWDFNSLEIHVIQCKTNWNDNAQIPMLWDMIYSATAFRNNVSVGREGYSMHNVKRFTYSFVTVPTSGYDRISSDNTCVQRVSNLSGGNYWGRPTQNNVASSVKEMLQRNLSKGSGSDHLTTLKAELPKLSTEYSYFRL